MKEYEVVYTYLNGCAGEAHPITTIGEVEAESPESYLQAKHGKDFADFVQEAPGKYRFDNGCVVHIYEFNEL